MSDYPDFMSRNIPGPTGEVPTDVGTFWAYHVSQSVAGGDTWTITITPGDDDNFYKLDNVSINITGDNPLSAELSLNGHVFALGYDDRQLIFPLSNNPTIEIGYNDVLTVVITNEDTSAHEIGFAIYGLKRYMPGGYTRVPMAEFEADVLEGEVPLTVNFSDLSKRFPTVWDWDYGDGSAHGSTQTPTHIYTVEGEFDVTLIASNSAGDDRATKLGYIIAKTYETFTTYTEVDPSSHLTVTSYVVTFANVTRNESTYLYKDYGVDNFDALDVDFEFKITTTSGLYSVIRLLGFSNTVGPANTWESTSIQTEIYRDGSSSYKLKLFRGHALAEDAMSISLNTFYYCTMERTAGSDTVTIKVYSDSDRTTLLDTLTVSGYGTAKWRYIYAVSSVNTGTTVTTSGEMGHIKL
jgi:PKD repeat protein